MRRVEAICRVNPQIPGRVSVLISLLTLFRPRRRPLTSALRLLPGYAGLARCHPVQNREVPAVGIVNVRQAASKRCVGDRLVADSGAKTCNMKIPRRAGDLGIDAVA
jgi:hypothetical protein